MSDDDTGAIRDSRERAWQSLSGEPCPGCESLARNIIYVMKKNTELQIQIDEARRWCEKRHVEKGQRAADFRTYVDHLISRIDGYWVSKKEMEK